MAQVIDLIINHKKLDKDLFEVKDVDGDGNCYFRTLSLHFTQEQSYYQFFREQIYNAAKENLKDLKEFFISDEKDEIIGNNKIEGYVNKIKDNYFFAGNIEIYITTKIFNLNIVVYERSNTNEDFTQYALFTLGTSTKEFILINFENHNHYNLLIEKIIKVDINTFDKNKAAINQNDFKFNKTDENIIPKLYFQSEKNKDNSIYIYLGNNKNYYENLYRYLLSYEKAKFVTIDKETRIHWDKLQYPKDLFNVSTKQKIKDKKKYNYRMKALNYTIENKILYFTGYGRKNNYKLRVPFENEKYSILSFVHINNGHLGINRTYNKIKELGLFWETMLEDIKEFINNSSKCIMSKNGKFIKTKSKMIIAKDPLERIVIDGWELDIDIKNITHYNWVIDIVDHFSKFLMSIPVCNNDSQNILYIV